MASPFRRLTSAVRSMARAVGATRPPSPEFSVTSDYEVIDPEDVHEIAFDGWSLPVVAERQDAAYRQIVRQMQQGQVRQDLQVAAEAARLTCGPGATILEVGCGSGYHSEILEHLLGYGVSYAGIDSSAAMVQLARQRYPARRFYQGDAMALPFRDAAFDVVFNGAALMHMPSYAGAIAETRRVAGRSCVFHTVPVMKTRATTLLRKRAYGGATVEVIFNESALLRCLRERGLGIRGVLDSIPYNLEDVLGEPTTTKTFVCDVLR